MPQTIFNKPRIRTTNPYGTASACSAFIGDKWRSLDQSTLNVNERLALVYYAVTEEIATLGLDPNTLSDLALEILAESGRLERPLVEQPVLTGVVRKFFGDEKKFGFIEPLGGGENVFFHQDRGVTHVCDGSEVPVCNGYETRQPVVGERVLYRVISAHRGPAASWWTFAEDYQFVLDSIGVRPVLRLRNTILNQTRWEGRDVAKFRYFYPKAWHSLPGNNMGIYEVQKLLSNGAWVVVDDPR